MELTLQLVQIIAFTALSVLCVTLVVVLVRVRRMLGVVEEDIKQISAKAMPVLDNLAAISGKIRLITESLSDQAETVKQIIGSFAQIADNVLAFEQRVQDRIEDPLMSTIETFASIFRGVQSFVERIPFVGRLRAQ